MEEDGVSLVGVIIIFVIVVIIAFIFAKPDNKKSMLNTVGLDLSDSAYHTLKEKEFARKCLIALTNATMKISQDVNGEKQFLWILIHILSKGMYNDDLNYLHVSSHYITHAWCVANDRYNEIEKNNEVAPLLNIDFSDETARKRYVKLLWEKYQYPWPSDWLKKENAL